MRNFDQIKILATAKKMKLAEVAEAAGITYQQLNRIIRTQSTTIDTMGRIASALNVPPSYFLEENNGDIISIGNDSPGAGKNNVVSNGSIDIFLRLIEEMSEIRKTQVATLQSLNTLIATLKEKK